MVCDSVGTFFGLRNGSLPRFSVSSASDLITRRPYVVARRGVLRAVVLMRTSKTAASQSNVPIVMEITRRPSILAQVASKLLWLVSFRTRLICHRNDILDHEYSRTHI